MTDTNPVQCPICGWTGRPADLDRGDGRGDCPACGESIKNSD